MELPVCQSLGLRACQLSSVLGCKLWHSRRKFTQEVWPGCFDLAWHLDGRGREQDRVKARQVNQVPCPAVWLCFSFPVSVQVFSVVHFLSACLSLCEWWIFGNFLFFCLYFGFSFGLSFALTLLVLRPRKFKLFVPLGLGLTNIDWHLYAFC